MSERYDELAKKWMEMHWPNYESWTPVGVEIGRKELAAHFRQASPVVESKCFNCGAEKADRYVCLCATCYGELNSVE
jgi:hypothetical protein